MSDYIPLPGTDGVLVLRRGKNFAVQFAAEDESSPPSNPVYEDLTGYGFRGQIRAAMDSADVILDFADYITLDVANGKASVFVPGGITEAITGDVPVDWVGGGEFYLIGSDPEEVIDAGTYTIHFEPDPVR